MPDYREWQDYVKAHPEIAGNRFADAPARIADLTTKSQMVVSHPGWQMFLDRVASRHQVLAARRTYVERELLDGDGTSDAILRLELRGIKGEMAGLDFATQIVPEMLEAGEKMLKELTGGSLADAAR